MLSWLNRVQGDVLNERVNAPFENSVTAYYVIAKSCSEKRGGRIGISSQSTHQSTIQSTAHIWLQSARDRPWRVSGNQAHEKSLF